MIGLVFALLPVGGSSLAEQALDEDMIKAIYSSKFGKFIEWPENAFDGQANFCILGENPFGPAALAAIEGESLKGHRMRVQRYASGLIPRDDLMACHVLYVSDSEKGRLDHILSGLAARPILTVSPIREFSRRGGMITLVKIGQHIRFEINPTAITRAGLEVSSKLLALALALDNGTGETP